MLWSTQYWQRNINHKHILVIIFWALAEGTELKHDVVEESSEWKIDRWKTSGGSWRGKKQETSKMNVVKTRMTTRTTRVGLIFCVCKVLCARLSCYSCHYKARMNVKQLPHKLSNSTHLNGTYTKNSVLLLEANQKYLGLHTNLIKSWMGNWVPAY